MARDGRKRDEERQKTIAPELLLENSIGYQLHQADKAVEAGMQLRLNRFGVPIGMYFYLRVLWLEDGLSQATLSRRVQTTTATTTLQLRRMEDRGFIRREASPSDRRKVHVYLTDSGRELEDAVLGEALKNRHDAFRGFSKEEIRQTVDLLTRIRRNMSGLSASNQIDDQDR